MKKLSFVLILFLTLTFFFINFSLAEGTPASFPCIFKGTITVNGDNTNFHTTDVTAYLTKTGEEANYTNTDPNPAFPVPLGRYYIMINNIDFTIGFKINGVNVDQNQKPQLCVSGNQTKLNLTATVESVKGETLKETNLKNLNITIGDSTDLYQGFFGEQKVEFKEGNSLLIEFNYDFSNELNLSNITIKKNTQAGVGSMEISGITLLGGQTKTVYIDNIANKDYVCIKDEENANVSEMTDTCSGSGEIAVSCIGAGTSDYTCTKESNRLKITGLKHSALKESSYSPPSTPTTSGGAGGGGGGGGGGGSPTPVIVTEQPLTYPDCKLDTDCKTGETCQNVAGEYYKQCVATTPATTTLTTPVAPGAATTPTGAVTAPITGLATFTNFFKSTPGKGILTTLVIIIVGLTAYFFIFRKK